jgi:hypothetical protein
MKSINSCRIIAGGHVQHVSAVLARRLVKSNDIKIDVCAVFHSRKEV